MTNTRIISHEFDYHAPESLSEALQLLQKPDAAVLAGGTDLINRLKLETLAPAEVLFLGKIDELRAFSTDNGIRIGAMVPMSVIEDNGEVKTKWTCLYQSVNSVGGRQIREMATVAGNIANASPAADVPPALIVLGAECELLSWNGGTSARTVKVEEIFTGPGKTDLQTGELIGFIHIPPMGKNCGTSFRKNARVKLDVAKASAAAFIRREGDTCAGIRIAAGSVAPTPVRARHVEDALVGRELDLDLVAKAAAGIADDIRPISDVRSSDWYRNHVMQVLVREAVTEAWKDSGGEELK